MLNLEELYEKYVDEESHEFGRVENKLSARADIHAFLLLDKLVPLDTSKPHCRNIVAAAKHDEIYLSTDCEELAEVITEEQFLELVRCGVMYDSDTESLSIFV